MSRLGGLVVRRLSPTSNPAPIRLPSAETKVAWWQVRSEEQSYSIDLG